MTPKDLKNSLLQLAIQGKLVEQRPEEGTALDLYREIQREKQSLIKSGKIKKEKPLPEIRDEEIPFDIPESWIWVRLGEIVDSLAGFAFKSEDFKPYGKFRLLRGINLGVNSIRWNDTVYVDSIPDQVKVYKLELEDVLLGLDRPWISEGTRVAIFKDQEETYLVQRVLRLRGIYGLSSYYIALTLYSSLFTNTLKGETTGISVPHISPKQVDCIPVPLPPLAEQKRIVAKIEEILPLIDRYEKAWTRLEAFNKRFPGDLQKSILQMAIQGKLVEQRPEEGTAEELYREIQREKQALIKAGKIKKEKALPEISEEEVPFDIPEGWKWVRLGEIFCIEMGQSPDGSSVSEVNNGIEFHQGKVFFGKQYLEVSPQKTSAPTKIAEANSVLLCVRAPVGKVNITKRKICIGRGLCSILPLANMDVYFVYYLLATYEHVFIRKATGTTFVAITGEVVRNQPIPLPPLAEQKRIVAKIEEILPLYERLK